MISVDNSAKKRVFCNSHKKDVLDLKEKVIRKIEEIETTTKDYNDLAVFETEKISDNISVFKFKKLIDEKINNLLISELTDIFKEELRILKNDLYLLLIADIDTIKNYLQNIYHKIQKLLKNLQIYKLKKYMKD